MRNAANAQGRPMIVIAMITAAMTQASAAESKRRRAWCVLGLDMIPPDRRTLFELLCEQAGHFPERIAVICGERVATYRDLADAARRIAAGLSAAGLGRG